MSISRIKQIKRILAHDDVRDPRASLRAIEAIVSQAKPKADKPLLGLTAIRDEVGKRVAYVIKANESQVEPKHVIGAIEALQAFGVEVFGPNKGKCDDPNCPVYGKPMTDLAELFKKFEADAIKAGGVKEGGAN